MTPVPQRANGSVPPADSGERSAAYRRVEGLHLRQVAMRSSSLIALLATNGLGWLDASVLPSATDWSFSACPWCVPTLGWLLVGLSAWLRILAKGVLVRKVTLTTGGAYRLVRHPFYLANLLGALGVFALAGSLGLLYGLAWFVPTLAVYVATVRGEEDGLGTLYPEAWQRYRSQVPALVPLPGRLGAPPETPTRVTFANLVREREPPRLLRFLAGALLVAAFTLTGAAAIAFFCGAVALFVASHFAPKPPSRRSGQSERSDGESDRTSG